MSISHTTTPPGPEVQLDFLANIQRLLAGGGFVATYKFALLQSLADLAVERGQDDNQPLLLPLDAIAEKFVYYYWAQTKPYTPLGSEGGAEILRQNTGTQAKVISSLIKFQQDVSQNISSAKANKPQWDKLIAQVRQTVVDMPLWRLQTVGEQTFDFLYPEDVTAAGCIELRPGVGYCLRRFHSLVIDLVRGAWLAFVRRHNLALLGSSVDLDVFLFGSERRPLGRVIGALTDVQHGNCFYCQRGLGKAVDVDHFIPWSRYSVDFGHNFVLAHPACNRSKSDHIAAVEHLGLWFERNAKHGRHITDALSEHGFLCDLNATTQVTQWAYELAEKIGEPGWLRGGELRPIRSEWRQFFV